MDMPTDDRELRVALDGPICPQLLREDAVVTNADGWYKILTPSSAWAADNEILFSRLGERALDAEIDAVLAEYHARGLPVRWCVYPWTHPRDLGERLLARGASHYGVQAMVVDTDLPLQMVEDTVIERVDPGSRRAFEDYLEVVASGSRLPADEVDFRRRRYWELIQGEHPSLFLFVARHQGAAAGCGAFVVKQDSAYMTGDFIKPEYQARGLFQSLHAARLQALRELGITLASGHAREDTSMPWLRRFGHRSKFGYGMYTFSAKAMKREVATP